MERKKAIIRSSGGKLKPQQFKPEMVHRFLTVKSGKWPPFFMSSSENLIQLFLPFLTCHLLNSFLIFFLSFELSVGCFSSFLNAMPNLELSSNEWKGIEMERNAHCRGVGLDL